METTESVFTSHDVGVNSASKSLTPTLERRTGRFTAISVERCNYYAEFMNHLSRGECEALFWSLIFTVIMLLSFVVYLTQKAHRISQLEPDLENGLDAETLARKNLIIRRKLLAVSLICFSLAVVSTIMDAFAGLAIAWCFGEDLINFYWSSWTLIDLGSVIAMLGTVLQQWYSLSSEGIQQPAWNFALGTPIPVMATIMHCLGFKAKRSWKSYKNKREERRTGKRISTSSRSTTMTSSSSSRISVSNAKFLSFSPNGKCIIEIEMSPEAIQKLPSSYPQKTSHSSPRAEDDDRELFSPKDSNEFEDSNTVAGSSSQYPQFAYPVMQYESKRIGDLDNGETYELPPLRRESNSTERGFRSREEEERWYTERERKRDGDRGRGRFSTSATNTTDYESRIYLTTNESSPSRPLRRTNTSTNTSTSPPRPQRIVQYHIPTHLQHSHAHSHSDDQRQRPRAESLSRSRSVPPRAFYDEARAREEGSTTIRKTLTNL